METSMINVIKRNGRGQEPLNLEKIHRMVEFACEGLAGVSESQVEMNANLQLFDGISSEDIQEILIKSSNDLISLDNPNYQYVAARLLLYGLRKSVYGEHPDVRPYIVDHINKCVEKKVYDKSIIEKYSDSEWEEIDGYIDNDRDLLFTYAGLRQVADKYLVQDRSNGKVFETPQQMYITVSYTHLTLPTICSV